MDIDPVVPQWHQRMVWRTNSCPAELTKHVMEESIITSPTGCFYPADRTPTTTTSGNLRSGAECSGLQENGAECSTSKAIVGVCSTLLAHGTECLRAHAKGAMCSTYPSKDVWSPRRSTYTENGDKSSPPQCSTYPENRDLCCNSSEQGNAGTACETKAGFSTRFPTTRDLPLKSQSSDDSDSAEVDCPINVIRRESQSNVGQFPRESIEQRLFLQDKSFDLNPKPKHHPVLSSLAALDEPDSPKLLTKLKHWLKDRFGADSIDPEDSEPPAIPILIHHPTLTESEHFGCHLQSFRSRSTTKECRWFHILRHVTPCRQDTLAIQLKLRENDEILMINQEVITLSDTQDVLEKFKYCLRNGEIILLLRRVVDINKFEFIEIKAQIEVTETMIRISCEMRLSRTSVGPYGNWKIFSRSGCQILNGGNLISCENGSLVVKRNDENSSYAFWMTTLQAWCSSDGFVYMCVLQEKNNINNFVEVTDSLEVKLTDAGERWTPESRLMPKQPDSRFFLVDRKGGSIMTFLRCVTRKEYYLGCYNSKLELLKLDDPVGSRDRTGFQIKILKKGNLHRNIRFGCVETEACTFLDTTLMHEDLG